MEAQQPAGLARLAAINALSPEMRDHALVGWKTVAAVLDFEDVKHCRKVVKELLEKLGLGLVEVTERHRLMTFGTLKKIIEARTIT